MRIFSEIVQISIIFSELVSNLLGVSNFVFEGRVDKVNYYGFDFAVLALLAKSLLALFALVYVHAFKYFRRLS